MNFFDAKETYRTRAGKGFRLPDLTRSSQDGTTWRLRDSHGKPIAIVSADGGVFGVGCQLHTTGVKLNEK